MQQKIQQRIRLFQEKIASEELRGLLNLLKEGIG
jgi:hypothetical protein